MPAYTPPFAQRPPPPLYSTLPENIGDPRLLFNTRVYIFAHKYKIETLRNLAASKFRAIAHAPLPTLFVTRTDMLKNTPALIQAGQLLCEVLNDPVERKGDLLWGYMKTITFANYGILNQERWRNPEAGRMFWERQAFGMEVFEAGWHTYGHLLTIIKGMEERLAGYDQRQ